MRIAVIGSGYVGLVSAACFAELGHHVVSVDNDNAKIASLREGKVLIHERFLPELLSRHRGNRLTFSSSVREAVDQSEAVFITVGTPQSETGEADLSFVAAVAQEIASAIRGYKVIVEKSTVPVRTCESIRKTLLLNGARPDLFSVASNPEFLREGTAVTDFMYPDRLVFGADDAMGASILASIYRPLTDGSYYRQENAIPSSGYAHTQAPLIVTDAKSAELIKHASNAFLAMKISFINAVSNIAESVGADIDQVSAGIGADSRIGTKFLNAGIGYGGSCFPKDVQAFRVVAEQCNYEFGMLTEVMRVNSEQRNRFLKKVRNILWTLRGKRLGVLGLAFKGDTDDVRESPALEIVSALLKEGASICAYDPVAIPNAKKILNHGNLSYASDPYTAACKCDAVLILTEWKEFAHLDLEKLRSVVKYPIVIDGRNLYQPKDMARSSFIYHSIGRSVAIPESMSHVEEPVFAQRESPTGFAATVGLRQAPDQAFAPPTPSI